MTARRPPAYARKTDRNHTEIRDGLRQCGYQVTDMSAIGKGIPDLLVGKCRLRCWVEVKMPGEKLTEAERVFFDHAPGCKIVVTSLEGALEQLRDLGDGE